MCISLIAYIKTFTEHHCRTHTVTRPESAWCWLYSCVRNQKDLSRSASEANLTNMDKQGAVSIRKTVLPGMAIPMLKIRRPTGRLIFNMGIPIPGKTVFYIETGPWSYECINGVSIPFCEVSKIVSKFVYSRIRTSYEKFKLKPGPRLNIKTVLSTYGDFHVKDKTVVRSLIFNMGIATPGKTVFLIETAPSTCAQSPDFGTRTKFQLAIFSINVISGICIFSRDYFGKLVKC